MTDSRRTIVWFSCGAASAVAAYLTLQERDNVEVVYCDTLAQEHPDNVRFMRDVEAWLGQEVTIIGNEKYTDVEDVWKQRKYMAGIAGAPCTVELKKVPRFGFQRADDVHVFGLTADEAKRIERFTENNHDLDLDWVLLRHQVTKQDCYRIIQQAGIEIPVMYKLGYKNNNCIGCVKATSPAYWSKVKRDFPEVFRRRAALSRKLGARLVRVDGKRMFLDEMPDRDYKGYEQENISCGPDCAQGDLFNNQGAQ